MRAGYNAHPGNNHRKRHDEFSRPVHFPRVADAGDAAKAERLHASYEYGVLAMDMYAFS